ncbi:Wzz/FepE/Etk N-terminal domain-containing protein, partial [Pseudomonas aeruginosa]|uniref:Wzz/FepE/Etk N-terminal domain-containing protein n=1 Tax=Pseudomonas aeruginosa TaxID=287 RepID=UPI001F4DE2E2
MTEKNFPSYKAKSGEFDLIEIMSGLWSLRWLIALLAVLPVLLAIVYLFITKPVYEARVSTLPPSLSDIAGFNLEDRKTGFPRFRQMVSIQSSCEISSPKRLAVSSFEMYI